MKTKKVTTTYQAEEMSDDDFLIIEPSLKEESKDVLMMAETISHHNPFFLPYEGSKFQNGPIKDMMETYKFIYILCLSNEFKEENIQNMNLFYKKKTEQSTLFNLSKNVTLLKTPSGILELNSILPGLIPVKKNYLECFNHEGYDLNQIELVYLMLHVKEATVRKFIDFYWNKVIFQDYLQQKTISLWYSLNNKKTDDNFIHAIIHLEEFRYWDSLEHRNISFTRSFMNRKFNLEKGKFDTKIVEDVNEIIKLFRKDFNEVIYPFQIKISKTANLTKPDIYYPYELFNPQKVSLNIDLIRNILLGNVLSIKEQYYFVANLLLSKDYCHVVLNNREVMEKYSALFKKFYGAFRYLISYSWIIFFKEETTKRADANIHDRYLFTLDVAHLLPVYTYDHMKPFLNPYFSMMVKESELFLELNIHGVRFLQTYQNGLVNMETFKRRLNLFIIHRNNDIFQGANWSHMAITGGIMSAIMPQTHPLLRLYKTGINALPVPVTDDIFVNFIEDFYNESDVDIICDHPDLFQFVHHVKHLQKIIKKNLASIFNVNKKDVGLKIKPKKLLSIFINSSVLEEKCLSGEINYSFDYIKKNKDKPSIMMYFYNLYLSERMKLNQIKNLEGKITDKLYFELINYVRFDKITLHIVPMKNEEDKPEELNIFYCRSRNEIFLKFIENLKFQIKSPYLKHPLEIFHVEDLVKGVAKFHLPCVRSFYNGSNCYLFPTAISSYMTMTNIDFRYFMGNKDPISIIEKYRFRGYGTIFNSFEIKQFLAYILFSKEHKQWYEVNENKDSNKILGIMEISRPYFRRNTKFMKSMNPFEKEPELNYHHHIDPFFLKRVIDADGNVEPISRWLIDAFYEENLRLKS
jgi:hypothetical protein